MCLNMWCDVFYVPAPIRPWRRSATPAGRRRRGVVFFVKYSRQARVGVGWPVASASTRRFQVLTRHFPLSIAWRGSSVAAGARATAKLVNLG